MKMNESKKKSPTEIELNYNSRSLKQHIKKPFLAFLALLQYNSKPQRGRAVQKN